MSPIPILLYHCVSDSPSRWIEPYTVAPDMFGRHLTAVLASGRTLLTVSELRSALCGPGPLPARPAVITFDDGFADTLAEAAPRLAEVGMPATVYVTTGSLGRTSPGGDRMLRRSEVAQLATAGHEIGCHTHTHPQLDLLSQAVVRAEITTSTRLLEDILGRAVQSFAYPHGYSTPAVRSLVAESGYTSACAVKDSYSWRADHPYTLARLVVRNTTTDADIRRWLAPTVVRPARPDDALMARGWRAYRRLRCRLGAPLRWPAGQGHTWAEAP